MVDIERAADNVQSDLPGEWYADPWGWPELGFLASDGTDEVLRHCEATVVGRGISIDVPKENWGSRPAVVLDVLDRLVYQAMVDSLSVKLIGGLPREVFGWRLPPASSTKGDYSHSNNQWNGYRRHLTWLASNRPVALRSDIVSYFASVPLDRMHALLDDASPTSVATKRLHSLLDGFAEIPDRHGLPQRSLASCVLANMYLRPLDDALQQLAPPVGALMGGPESHAFARWMDDFWLFTEDVASARKAQKELQGVLRSIGLNLNTGKTEVLEGDAVAEAALQIEHSAVDVALKDGDLAPLEELVDRLLADPAQAGRTSLRFVSTRMRAQRSDYRLQDLLDSAPDMPHGSDALAAVFQFGFKSPGLQDWLLWYAKSDWAAFEGSVAHYVRMFPSKTKPQKATIEFVTERVADSNTSLPLLAVAAQRLAAWDEAGARAIIADVMGRTSHPQKRRVLSLAAATAGIGRSTLRRWLSAERENTVTLGLLERDSFTAPKVRRDTYSR